MSVRITLFLSVVFLFSGLFNSLKAQSCDASFRSSTPLKGENTKATFTDSGSQNAKHTWYFGDGTVRTDTSVSTTYLYNKYDTFQVCHVIKSGNCRDSTCQQVSINCDKTVSYNYRIINNRKVSFSINGNSPDSVTWQFGDSSKGFGKSTTHTYQNYGNYTFSVKVIRNDTPRCVATAKDTVSLTCNANANFTTQSKNGKTRTFSTNATADTFFWNYGDGTTDTVTSTTQQHTFAKPDTYNVKLIAKKGPKCADTQSQQVIINCQLGAGFTGSQINSSGKVKFKDTGSSKGLHTWYLGDGTVWKDTTSSVTYNYHKYGTFQACHVTTNGNCKDSTCHQVSVQCDTSLNISFFALSNTRGNFQVLNSPVDSAIWQFGDSSKGFGRRVTNNYDTPGSYQYNVKVIVNDTPRCVVNKKDSIKVPCNADAGWYEKGDYKEKIFKAREPNAKTYIWDYDDGNVDTTSAPVDTHTYSQTGTYRPTVIAKNGPNCSDTSTNFAWVSCDTGANRFSVRSQNAKTHFFSTNADRDTYIWDFGDSSKDTTTKSFNTHTYNQTGNYNVTLIAKYDSSCVDTLTKQVHVKCANAGFSVNSADPNVRTFSTPSRTDTLYWDFGDGTMVTTDTSINQQHTYAKADTYRVKLIAKEGPNCADTQTKKVAISCNVDAGFAFSGNESKRNFRAFNSAKSYQWRFGDGSTDTSRRPSHTYSKKDTFQVQLVAKQWANCADTQTKKVAISCNANAGFAFGGDGYKRSFRAFNSAKSYQWQFGDGSTDTAKRPSHTYSKKDTFQVQLVAKQWANCADTNTKQIVIQNDNFLKGDITLPQGNADSSDRVVVDLFRFDSCKGVYNNIRTQKRNASGDSARYLFDSLPSGKFHVRVKPDSGSSISSNFVATYHKKASKWGKADSIVFSGLGNRGYGNDITLLKSSNSNGTGNITGFVGGSKANCTNKRPPESGSLANIPVLLLNKDREPVARTTTDQDGNYDFEGLSFGTYYIRVDLPGYEAEAKKVTLGAENPEKEADFKVDGPQITVDDKSTGVAEAASKADVKLYPSPAKTQVNVQVANLEADQVSLNVTNMRGQVITQQMVEKVNGPQTIQLDVNDWPSGGYIIKLQDQHGQVQAVKKLMVR